MLAETGFGGRLLRITNSFPLKEVLGLLDIRVLDHLVIGGTEVVSFAERGLL